MTRPFSGRLVVAVAVGGALGAAVRALVTDAFPAGPETFPWAVLAINVSGSALLALLPALAFVRRSAWLPPFLGTGVLGGYTTMSAAVVTPVRAHDHTMATAYVLGTLAAAFVAVWLVDRLSTPWQRAALEEAGADE